MTGQGLSSAPRRRGRSTPTAGVQGSRVQQGDRLVMLLLVIVPGYVLSRPVWEEPDPKAVLSQSRPTVRNLDPVQQELIGEHIREMANRYGVSEALIAAIIAVESEYNPR